VITYIALHKNSGTRVTIVAEDELDARLMLIYEYGNYDFDEWVMTEVDVNTRGITEIS